MARQRKKNTEAAQDAGPAPRTRLLGRGKTLLLGALFLLLGVAFFAPTIVAHTPLRHHVVPLVVPQFQGTVSIGNASLGWFSPIQLAEVSATDMEGQPLASIAIVRSEKTLLSLATNQRDLGRIQLVKPHVHLQLRADGSNVEDALAGFFDSSESGGERPQVSITVEQGTVDINDAVAGKSWQVTPVDASFEMLDTEGSVTGKLSTGMTGPGQPPAHLEAEMKWQSSTSEAAGGGQAVVRLVDFPLASIQAALRRVVPDAQISGIGSTQCDVRWDASSGSQVLQLDEFAVRDLHFQGPSLFGNDQLRLKHVSAEGGLEFADSRLTAKQFKASCDLAKIEADVTVPTSDLAKDLLGVLLQPEDYRIVGEMDLAMLANMLPETLRLREQLELTSGKVTATMYSRVEGENRRWATIVETANLTAMNNGRAVRWDQPIQLTMFVAKSADGPVIEHLTCNSSFLKIQGKGALAKGSITAVGDLDRLAAEAGQFVDVQGLKLAGKLDAELGWDQLDDQGRTNLRGGAAVKEFEVVLPGLRPWREENLTVSVDSVFVGDSNGAPIPSSIQQFESGNLQVTSGIDSLRVELVESASSPSGNLSVPVQCRLVGGLGSWLPRIQTWVPLPGWQLDGDVELQCTARFSPQKTDVTAGSLTLSELSATGHGLRIKESTARIEGIASWNSTTRELTSAEATLVSSSVACRTNDVKIRELERGPEVTGQIAYRGDLGRVMTWTHGSADPPRQHFYGMIVGQGQLAYQDGVTLANWTADITDFIAARRKNPKIPGEATPAANSSPWEAVWREDQIKLVGKGDYSHANGELHLDQIDVEAPSVRVAAHGTLKELTTVCQAEIDGELVYNWNHLSERLRPFVSRDLVMSGTGQKPFTIRGPLLNGVETQSAADSVPAWPPADLTAQMAIDWKSASAKGFEIGPSELQAVLSGGVIRAQPMHLSVNHGRVNLEPQVFLHGSRNTLTLKPGSTVERVQISPEMFKTWMKYLAPLLADATRTQGELSMELSEAQVPLADPMKGTVRGQLKIHSARVGPGPMGRQIEAIVRQVAAVVESGGLDPRQLGGSASWINLPEQTVSFQMIDGKVYHENLQLVIGGLRVHTNGHVGTDQSVSMVAKIPLGEDLVGNNPLLASFRGQVIEIPVSGTLTNPVFDNRILSNLTKSLGNGLNRLIEDELKNGLEGLFRLDRNK